jgi:hypothetical protein
VRTFADAVVWLGYWGTESSNSIEKRVSLNFAAKLLEAQYDAKPRDSDGVVPIRSVLPFASTSSCSCYLEMAGDLAAKLGCSRTFFMTKSETDTRLACRA